MCRRSEIIPTIQLTSSRWNLRFVLNTLAEFLSSVCVDILSEDTSLLQGLIFYVEVISSQAFVMPSNIIVRP